VLAAQPELSLADGLTLSSNRTLRGFQEHPEQMDHFKDFRFQILAFSLCCAALAGELSGCSKSCTPGRVFKDGSCVPLADLERKDVDGMDASVSDATADATSGSKTNASTSSGDGGASNAAEAGNGLMSSSESTAGAGGSTGQVPMNTATAGSGGTPGDGGGGTGGGDARGSDGSGTAGVAGGAPACTTECCDDTSCPTNAKCEQGKCVCPAAQHACQGACVDNMSPATCGTGCDACAVPSGGEASCDGTQCGSVCPGGTRLCAGACIADSMPCDNVCPQGTHNCSDNCVDVTSVTACADSCRPCNVPANGKATCDGKACGFECNTNYQACGDACISADACCDNADCDAANQERCNTGDHRCECREGLKACEGRCIAMDACCSSADCGSDQVCDRGSNRCGCSTSTKECNGSCIARDACCAGSDTGNRCSGGVCNAAGRCVECVDEAECADQDQHCDTQRSVCVECRNASDCPGADFARCDNGKCSLAEGCGNGEVDGDDECDVGAVGAPGTPRWSSSTCTSDCRALIYITSTSAAASGCNSPKVSNEILQCTLNCSSDADCPALGKSMPQAECNITGDGTCQVRCSGNNDCLTRSGTTCLQLMGLPSMPFVCANPGF